MKNWLEIFFGKTFTSHLAFFLLFSVSVTSTSGLRCYQCGQYTDGPGSITPCINYTDALHLKECPPEASSSCIKYVNEGSTVRECADECNEKRSDSWGTSIYCCYEDACNSASYLNSISLSGVLATALIFWRRLRLSL